MGREIMVDSDGLSEWGEIVASQGELDGLHWVEKRCES